MIVINVDIAGNGRAGASSKCVEAGNEPHQFFRCQLFHGAAEETGRAGPWFVRQPLPTAGSWGQTCPPPAPWDGPAELPAGTGPWEAGNGPRSGAVFAVLWVTMGYLTIQLEGAFT